MADQVIETFSGGQFDYRDPLANPIAIEDVAHAISMQCRFGGHLKQFYSVAQHCCNVSLHDLITGPVEALAGLLHDAAEAFMCDLPSPLKHRPGMNSYRDLEDEVLEAILRKTCGRKLAPHLLELAHSPGMKRMDIEVTLAERNLFLNHDPEYQWEYDLWGYKPCKLYYWSLQGPVGSKEWFLCRFYHLLKLCKEIIK